MACFKQEGRIWQVLPKYVGNDTGGFDTHTVEMILVVLTHIQ